MNKVPCGIYRGQEWSEVPESYLFWIVNEKLNVGKVLQGFPLQCREEIDRRYERIGKPSPWKT